MPRHVTRATIWDAPHFTPTQRTAILESYPEHEREARARGIPQLGSGRAFPLADEAVAVAPFQPPAHWPQLGAIDFGWDHPTAAVRLAWDRDNDVAYAIAAYRVRQATPVVHAGSLRAWGPGLPFAWPHDGYQHDKQSGRAIADAYREQGLRMLARHACFEDGSAGLEAGLMAMLERMQTGRLKVFAHLADWFDEFRLYHRKDGLVVKQNDDLMSATRYGIMSLRFAEPAARAAKPAPAKADGRYDPLSW